MKSYENKLNEIFTRKVMEFLNEGYLFVNKDTSMGYFQRVELYKNETQLRLTISEILFDDDINEYYGLINKYKFKARKMKLGQTFVKNEDEIIFEKNLYVYKNEIICENLQELIDYYELKK